MTQKTIFINEIGQKRLFDPSVNNNEIIKNYLGAEDYEQYHRAFLLNLQLWDDYLNQGLYTIETVHENIFIPELNESVDIPVGTQNVLAPDVQPSQLQLHPEFLVWRARIPLDLEPNTIID